LAFTPRRPVFVLIACGALLAALGVGWLLASRFESPAQRSASARAPHPGPLYATVSEGRLAESVHGSGVVAYRATEGVTFGGLPPNAVVTGRPASVGSQVSDGAVVAEVRGRPVFVFGARFPFYRDLRLGEAGPDVLEFQRALQRAGASIYPREFGRYGVSTRRAVAHLYRASGFSGSGTSLPLSEISTTRVLPATVQSTFAIGTRADGAGDAVQLGRGAIAIDVSLDSSFFVQVRSGMSAQSVISGSAQPVQSSVVELISHGTSRQPTVVLAPNQPLPPATIGKSAISSIDLRVVAQRALLLPSRAIATTAAGDHQVLVLRAGTTYAVRVNLLGSLSGLTAVAPRDGADSLRAGDHVKVG
jgi:peptidoglycan hydrolase-like protein with peptidoglycan-binding domain